MLILIKGGSEAIIESTLGRKVAAPVKKEGKKVIPVNVGLAILHLYKNEYRRQYSC